jgi:hypothetical protein
MPVRPTLAPADISLRLARKTYTPGTDKIQAISPL